MAKVRLTIALGDYELARPITLGQVAADGIELVPLVGMGSRERHWRMARRNEFDICEVNVGAYFMERDRNDALTAIPVFLHRRFRHGFIFVNHAAGITKPEGLAGLRIGGTNFQPAAAVWLRGLLEERYGVKHRDVTWVTERSEDVEFEVAPGLRIERTPNGEQVEQMLLEGKLPAILAPNLPRSFVNGDSRIKQLFADPKAEEIAYFRETGIFPIMHVTVIKREIVDRYPWIPTNLVKAFDAAKAIAYRRAGNPRVPTLAWARDAWDEQRAILGEDPFQYGMGEANRKNLDTILRYTHEQGMIARRLPLDDLFAATDLGDAGGEEAEL
jgi:4,5-dihydroxyphthalate decarboxylase